MFSFGKDYKVIDVTFYEGKSGKPFAQSNVPVEQLPDTFEIDTTMHLGKDDWRVVGAEPPQKTQFKQSGKLSLFLSKVEITNIDPKELLYSLPTISNDIAGVENAKSLENVVILREDDWRQFEFVGREYESSIESEFKSISDIYKNHHVGMGFKELHVRKIIPAPLIKDHLTLEIIKSSFTIEKIYSGVAFNNAAATIVGGFALHTKSGWLLWGQIDNSDAILVLNISQTKESSISIISKEIDSFTEKHNLYLVDWLRLFWSGPGKLKFAKYGE